MIKKKQKLPKSNKFEIGDWVYHEWRGLVQVLETPKSNGRGYRVKSLVGEDVRVMKKILSLKPWQTDEERRAIAYTNFITGQNLRLEN